jgi:hypothetical protein
MKRATEGRCCSESPSPIPPENHLRPALSPHGKTKPKTQLKETCVSSGITLEDHAKPASSVSMCAMCAIGVPAGGDLWVNCYLHCVKQKNASFRLFVYISICTTPQADGAQAPLGAGVFPGQPRPLWDKPAESSPN